jgi:hypothetical protein
MIEDGLDPRVQDTVARNMINHGQYFLVSFHRLEDAPKSVESQQRRHQGHEGEELRCPEAQDVLVAS